MKSNHIEHHYLTIEVDSDNILVKHEGQVYFQMEAVSPTIRLGALQTKTIALHPKRNPSLGGVYYLTKEKGGGCFAINHAARESEVPAGCQMGYNWFLNKRAKEQQSA